MSNATKEKPLKAAPIEAEEEEFETSFTPIQKLEVCIKFIVASPIFVTYLRSS